MTKPIYVLCLHNVRTGGPEAIHQLSDALIEQGFDATITYYTWEEIAALERAEPQDGYAFGIRKNTIAEYHRYRAMVCNIVKNDPNSIVVLPETLCHLAPKFNKATVLIWWLSVDNGFGALSKVNLNHLRAPNVKHAAQSEYAARFCESLGLSCKHWLTDYTTDLTEYATPLPMSERPKLVLFNANHKVTADLQAIADELGAIDPQIECIPLRSLPRPELATLFSRARVYVDLGNFPGKDRGPREAANMGCSVLVANAGASNDFPWADRVDNRISVTHQIYGLVEVYGGIVRAPKIAFEQETFMREVRSLFTDLC